MKLFKKRYRVAEVTKGNRTRYFPERTIFFSIFWLRWDEHFMSIMDYFIDHENYLIWHTQFKSLKEANVYLDSISTPMKIADEVKTKDKIHEYNHMWNKLKDD